MVVIVGVVAEIHLSSELCGPLPREQHDVAVQSFFTRSDIVCMEINICVHLSPVRKVHYPQGYSFVAPKMHSISLCFKC